MYSFEWPHWTSLIFITKINFSVQEPKRLPVIWHLNALLFIIFCFFVKR